MSVSLEQAQELVIKVRAALLDAEVGAKDVGTQRRLKRLHLLLGGALPLLAEHFQAPVQTFSGGEPKPEPTGD